MKIKRIYNNNVVVSNDMSGKEIIIIGRGIAFQKKVGEEIDQVKVEKIFSANDESIENNLKRLLESIPANNLELCHDIVTMINKNSELKVSDNIYVTLADHLSVSLKREQGN